jgi:hypothetical protein
MLGGIRRLVKLRRYVTAAFGLVSTIIAQPGALSAGSVRGVVQEADADTFVMPAWQTAALIRGTRDGSEAILKSCDTNKNNGDSSTPPAVNGAVGPANLLVTTHSHVTVYARSDCTQLADATLKAFFDKFPEVATKTIIWPRSLYDPRSKRFVVAAVSSFSNNEQYLYLAISKNASGQTWYRYRIILRKDANVPCATNANASFTLPTVGHSANRWFLTLDEVGPFAGLIFSIDKTPTLTGAKLTLKCFEVDAPANTPPIVLDNNNKAYFLSTANQSSSSLVWFYPLTTGAAASNDTIGAQDGLSTLIGDFNGWIKPDRARQPNGELLETNARFSAPSMQAGHFVWNVHTQATDLDSFRYARWRLYKFNILQRKVVFTHSPRTIADDEDTFNASLATTAAAATDPDAPIYVNFSRTVQSKPSAGRPAMLIAKGPSGRKAGWTYQVIATSPGQYDHTLYYNNNPNMPMHCNDPNVLCRWGPWSSTQIDPSDPTKGWGFNQLVTTGTVGGAGSHYNWMTKGAQVD